MAPAPRFVHLKTHSAYSLLEGALPVARLLELTKASGMPALALTDTDNLFGALEFSEVFANAGVQPIVGCSLSVSFADAEEEAGPGSAASRVQRSDGRIALLAKDATGYAGLMKLASAAYLANGEADEPVVSLDALAMHAQGLIALSGGPSGPIDLLIRDGRSPQAAGRLAQLKALFADRLYVEVQRHGTPEERDVEPELIRLSYELELPLVATNEPFFAVRDDYEAHDALICIADGSYVIEDDRRRLTPEHYFKSQDEMAALFADLPEAIENTIEIAQRCAFRPVGHAPILPQFLQETAGKTPEEVVDAEAAELSRQAHDGLQARLKEGGLAEGTKEQDYIERLDYELDVITKMKFPGYFLIVSDFIKWAKKADIPVGPGRGSGAGSLVAYSLTITDLDPLRFGLLFERFLNPERVSMPDFDIDFCQDRRDEVIRYVQERYGEDRVAQIITFGKLLARAVLRDVGRVLGMPYGQVDRLCKMVPNNPANPVTLAEALESEPPLQEARDSDPAVATLLEMAQKLEGLYRHASTHAAGVVIGDRSLDELVPLYQDARSALPASQFNLKWVEAAGLVKFDFLGLKTLTVIRKAVDLVQARGIKLKLATMDLDDAAAYELMARADTAGVFQLEGTGMRDSLRQLRPDRFEDIIAMVALYRPGPMDNIPVYIARKHGTEEVDYLHPMLEPVLKETYGVIIYQEQVQKIAQVMAGYSLGQADILRRAMGKKNKEEMAREKDRFVSGAVENGVDKEHATYIFELVDKFAGYGFNKSHAAAYALVAYHTAYLKANYPVEFMAASMTLDMGNTDKLSMFVEEARRLDIALLPPCVNASGIEFQPEDGAIRYSLAALKNIGRTSVEHIAAVREEGGAFADLSDFARRIDPRQLNKRALETLAAAGAFDALEAQRSTVYENVENVLALANRLVNDRELGQDDLFGSAGDTPGLDLRATRPWLPMDQLEKEFDAVGFYLSGHPLDQYQDQLDKLGAVSWATFAEQGLHGTTTGLIAGIVTACRERTSQKGNRFAFAGFSDASGQFEAVIFSEALAAARDLLVSGTPVLLRVEGEGNGDTVKLRAASVESLEAAAKGVRRGCRVVLDAQALHSRAAGMDELRKLLKPGGRGEVRLIVPLGDARQEVELALPGRYDLSHKELSEIGLIDGVVAVQDL